MMPFADCLGCHSGSGQAQHRWTAAGTWRRGTEVTFVDANGKSVTVRGNDVGNFYTAEPLAFPLHVFVDGKEMAKSGGTGAPITLQYGGCNACHHAETVTTGPLMAPGADCMTCHGPSGMATAKFSAAGTAQPAVFGTGASVDVAGITTRTNSVGNFYYPSTARMTFPASASVAGRSMEGGAPSGGCNACHQGGIGAGESGGGN